MAGDKPGPPRKTSDYDLLRQIQLVPFPAAVTTDVSNNVEIDQRQVVNRLDELEDRGYVKSKVAGDRGRLWALTTEGEEYVAEHHGCQ
jgi:DNA-binding MarR family transcriptional regulator